MLRERSYLPVADLRGINCLLQVVSGSSRELERLEVLLGKLRTLYSWNPLVSVPAVQFLRSPLSTNVYHSVVLACLCCVMTSVDIFSFFESSLSSSLSTCLSLSIYLYVFVYICLPICQQSSRLATSQDLSIYLSMSICLYQSI